MVWKLQGFPAPASATKTGLSTYPQPPTHPVGSLVSPPWAHQSDHGLSASQKPKGAPENSQASPLNSDS